jgi:hypothetical protein
VSSIRLTTGVLAAGLALTVGLSGAAAAPAWAAGPAPTAAASALVADPTNLATDEDKVKAAGALGINPGVDMLVLNDQEFVLSLWRQAKDGSFIKAAALRAYDTSEPSAAYDFITTGIFAAAAVDAQAEIAEAQARAVRRSVAVTVGLDPSDTELIEKGDRDFIFSVWQRVTAGSHVWTAARDAIADGTGQDEWTAFLTTGAQAAAELDMKEAIEKADAEQAAILAAQQLATAKRSLLQLLLLPVTDELINAPNRQYVLNIHNTAKGTEVLLAAQAALNAPDADLEKALRDFIFTGGAAANKKDEDAAAAKELAGYRTQTTAIRDAAKLDGLENYLVDAANAALTTGTLLALQTFLLKGQDEARVKDRQARAAVVLSGTRVGVLAADGNTYVKEGTVGSATWVKQYGGVKQIVLAGTRIGVLAYDGTAYVKDGTLSAAWTKMYTGVKQIALTSNRVGVLTYDGTAYVKEGGLSTAWVKENTGIQKLVLSGTRIGLITTSGTATVKDGGLSAAWDQQHTGVKELALTSNRVGVLTTAGAALVKEGALSSDAWVTEYTGVKQLGLTGTRISIMQPPNISVPEKPIPENAPGRALVKEGGLSALWTEVQPSDVIRVVVDGTRIAVLLKTGAVYLKEGTLTAPWQTIRTITGL